MQISNLAIFVCTVGLVFAALVCAIENSKAENRKVGLKRKLSLEYFENIPKKLRRQQSTASEIDQTDQLGKSNDNMVSELLHFIHRKSGDAIFKKLDQDGKADVKAEGSEPDYSKMSDQEIMDSLCDGLSFERLCKKATKAAMLRKPEDVAKIAQAIREKPAHVEARKLLAHKLLETGIIKAEAKGYDKALNSAINVMATKNPYAYSAVKAINMTRKLM